VRLIGVVSHSEQVRGVFSNGRRPAQATPGPELLELAARLPGGIALAAHDDQSPRSAGVHTHAQVREFACS
jgi:hypothetical protein